MGPHTVLPVTISCPLHFPESHQRSEISSLSKVILVLGKARSHWVPNLGCRAAESPGWFDVSPKSPRERACCHDEAANLQLLISAAFWVIWVSMEEWSWNVNGKSEADSLFYSIILNVTATQYTCSLNGVYHPHWLVQWGHHCSHRCIRVHSPWLPGFIDAVPTLLVILIMIGLFPDKPCIFIIILLHTAAISYCSFMCLDPCSFLGTHQRLMIQWCLDLQFSIWQA